MEESKLRYVMNEIAINDLLDTREAYERLYNLSECREILIKTMPMNELINVYRDTHHDIELESDMKRWRLGRIISSIRIASIEEEELHDLLNDAIACETRKDDLGHLWNEYGDRIVQRRHELAELIREQNEANALAFMSATHPRLGQRSQLRVLDPHLLHEICAMAYNNNQ